MGEEREMPGEEKLEEQADRKAANGEDKGDKPSLLSPEHEEIARWKAQARKHEQRFKDLGIDPERASDLAGLKDRLARLAEIEESNKTEGQKALERAEAAERRALEAEAKALRAEIASDMGLTSAQARRLVGSTREELEADAQELLRAFGGKGAAEDGEDAKDDRSDFRRPPREKLRPGAVPASEPIELDPRKLAEKIPPMYG